MDACTLFLLQNARAIFQSTPLDSSSDNNYCWKGHHPPCSIPFLKFLNTPWWFLMVSLSSTCANSSQERTSSKSYWCRQGLDCQEGSHKSSGYYRRSPRFVRRCARYRDCAWTVASSVESQDNGIWAWTPQIIAHASSSTPLGASSFRAWHWLLLSLRQHFRWCSKNCCWG